MRSYRVTLKAKKIFAPELFKVMHYLYTARANAVGNEEVRGVRTRVYRIDVTQGRARCRRYIRLENWVY